MTMMSPIVDRGTPKFVTRFSQTPTSASGASLVNRICQSIQ
jgi:hypothetical protein